MVIAEVKALLTMINYPKPPFSGGMVIGRKNSYRVIKK